MKKLIAMLNTFTLLSSTITTVVSCTEGKKKSEKTVKKHKKDNEVDLEKQKMMKQLKQLDQKIEVKLLKKVLIADGINTYKTVKKSIETDLINLALTKNAILQIEFINSIFKDDSELIYKSENPFEVKIDLIAKENDHYFLSKVYKISAAEGLTKEYLETKKNKDLEYDSIREIIKQVFTNETFIDNLTNLVNIKANAEHTVKDLITVLNSLDNTSIFGEKEDINKYKFHYATSLDSNDKLLTDKNLTIEVYVFDEEENQPFFKTEFELKILGEDDSKQYEKIAEKVKKYMNNKELDLSVFKELDADGKIKWQQTLSKIVKPDMIYDYFNFQPLGSDFQSEYVGIVDFSLTLDTDQIEDVNDAYFAYNSEKDYVPIKLKVFKKGTFDSTFKEKNVDLKIKIGGLTEQEILNAKQEQIKQIFNKNVNGNLFTLEDSVYSNFLETYMSAEWTWFNLLAYLKDRFFTYFKFNELDISKDEITSYVDIDFLNIFDDDEKKDLDLNSPIFDSISASSHNELKVKITPKQMRGLKVENEWIISYYLDFNSFRRALHYSNYFSTIIKKNQSVFNEETVVFKQDSSDSPVKTAVLIDYLKNKLKLLLESNPYYEDIPKYFGIWPEVEFEGKPNLETRRYKLRFNIKNIKYDKGNTNKSVFL